MGFIGDPISPNKTDALAPYKDLAQHFEARVLDSFTVVVREHVVDYIFLEKTLTNNRTYFYDHSFLLLPLCKALEAQLFNILLQIGFFENTDNERSLAAKMRDPKKQQKYKEKLTLTGIKEPRADAIVNKIISMADFYEKKRNLPTHVSGTRKRTLEQAQNAARSIIDAINEYTEDAMSVYNEMSKK